MDGGGVPLRTNLPFLALDPESTASDRLPTNEEMKPIYAKTTSSRGTHADILGDTIASKLGKVVYNQTQYGIRAAGAELRAKYEGPNAPVRIARMTFRPVPPTNPEEDVRAESLPTYHLDNPSVLSFETSDDDPPIIKTISDVHLKWFDDSALSQIVDRLNSTLKAENAPDISSMFCYGLELPESEMVRLLGITGDKEYRASVKESVLNYSKHTPSKDADSARSSEPASTV